MDNLGKRRFMAIMVAFTVVSAGGACSALGTDTGVKPTRAHIEVDGTTLAPLELVVSTDFFETVRDGEVVQVKNSADTLLIDLPFDQMISLTDLGSILVELTNHEEALAQVEMRVTLDTGQEPYQQSATMSAGGTLRYIFVFLQRRL